MYQEATPYNGISFLLEPQGKTVISHLQKNHLMDATKSAEDVVTIEVTAAKELLAQGHKYLDVRTDEEFSKSHVDEALNIPYMFISEEGRIQNPEFLAQVSSVCKKEDQLVVACNKGGRGLLACVDLLNAGYTNVANLGGGYSAWVDNEYKGNEKAGEELKIACKFRPK